MKDAINAVHFNTHIRQALIYSVSLITLTITDSPTGVYDLKFRLADTLLSRIPLLQSGHLRSCVAGHTWVLVGWLCFGLDR